MIRFKSGDKVRLLGERDLYVVHTVYSLTEVSLGLLDYPDVEQDYLTETKDLIYINEIWKTQIVTKTHESQYT